MIFLLFLPLVLLICFFSIAFFINAIMFRPDKKINPPTDGHKVIFRSGKNHLAGYIWNESGKRGLIVFAHGMGVGIEYYLPEIHHFAKQGYKVFAFEYSGYCGSSGHFYGFPQAVIDLKNALNFIDDGKLPIILMGHSMGGYAVCSVLQCTDKKVDGIIAYAPFFSPDAAIITQTTGGKSKKGGRLLCCLILLVQRILFGKNSKLKATVGLSRINVPTLILQGSEDVEVTPDGCALYAHKDELSDNPVTFWLVIDKESNAHMTIVRKKGSHTVNEDTIYQVDKFLDMILNR